MNPFQIKFQIDALDLFKRIRASHMGAHMYENHAGMMGDLNISGDRMWHNAATLEPDYYIPSQDIVFLRNTLPELAQYLPRGLPVVDLGPGSIPAVEEKSLPIVQTLQSRFYRPIDMSSQYAHAAARFMQNRMPDVQSEGVIADIFSPHTVHGVDEPVLTYFGGATITNLLHSGVEYFPREVLVNTLKDFRSLTRDGWLLISYDSNNNEDHLFRAYGTYWFGLFACNVFYRIAAELPHRGFDPDAFDYIPEWNAPCHQFIHYLVARHDLNFTLAGQEFRVAQGEKFNVLNSYKFPTGLFHACAEEAGFEIVHDWQDSSPLRLILLRVHAEDFMNENFIQRQSTSQYISAYADNHAA